METPRVTVIIAAYNAEAWIGEALASINAQSYRQFEVVVADDGSTDATRTLAREAGARVLELPHRGLGATRNAAVDAVASPLLMFVDADDTIHRDMLQSMVAIRDMTGAEVVTADVAGRADALHSSQKFSVLSGEEGARRLLYQRGVRTVAVAKLIERELFDGGLRFPEVAIFEDLLFTYRLLAKAERVAVMPAKMYFYRRGHESLTSAGNPKRLRGLEVARQIEQTAKEHYPSLVDAARARHASAAVGVIRQIAKYGYVEPELSDKAWAIIVDSRARLLRDRRIKPLLRMALLASLLGRRCFTKISTLWRGR